MSKGKIEDVSSLESGWVVRYRTIQGGTTEKILDWDRFARLYEDSSGRNFQDDYDFGQGSEKIRKYFKDKIILIEYSFWGDEKINVKG
jgi:hypothetical protein